MWAPLGEQPLVPSAGQDRRAPVFGGLDALTGRLTILVTERKRSADFLAFLRRLLKRCAGRHIFLLLDNCSIHRSKVVERFLADRRNRITPIWNAPYAPELNLIERYWGHLKAKAIHNYFFGAIDDLKGAIREAVAAMNRSKTLRLTLRLQAMHSLREAA